MSIGIILQARLASSRLPQKVMRPLIDGKSILDIMLIRLRKLGDQLPLVLATGDLSTNFPLKHFAESNNLQFFAGSENDVLKRFIDCAEQYGFTRILRVCADNPFIDIELARRLLDHDTASGYDYLSYSVNGVPAILTHYGLFTELVTLECLKRAYDSTSNASDREHVTKYIYSNGQKFSVKLLQAPPEISQSKDIRLTIDTETDFANAALVLEQLMRQHADFDYNYKDVISVILHLAPSVIQSMKMQIFENSK